MTARDGDVVGIYYDARADLDVGDALVTRTGRAYLVVIARRQTRGRHVGRWHLRCRVYRSSLDLPGDTRLHPLVWYRRDR